MIEMQVKNNSAQDVQLTADGMVYALFDKDRLIDGVNVYISPMRYVPLEVLETAEKHMDNPSKASKYICAAFCLFRKVAANHLFVPHVYKNQAFEWPDPVEFSWSDIDSIIGTESLVYVTPKNFKSVTKDENVRAITEINVQSGETTIGLEKIPDYEKALLSLKFKTPNIRSIGLVGTKPWREYSLSCYVNSTFSEIDNLENGTSTKKEIQESLSGFIDSFKPPARFPVAHFKGTGEDYKEYEPDPTLLFLC